MNEVLNAIFTRRSTRAFTDEKLTREELELLLKAGAAAPTAMNRQYFGFVAVANSEKLSALNAAIGEALGKAEYSFYKPAALIIPYTKRDFPLGIDDNACAMENIYLAAHSMGLGCVWINQLRDTCDAPGVRALLRDFGVPDECVVYGSAAVGHPVAPPANEMERRAVCTIVE
ncbi:MAG: nitroreductase family protein [Oscillospiraceae bacterium]|nr:nitroreductase family protein [Oscillospiraceae bacterium]